jgi:phage gpG-like protein
MANEKVSVEFEDANVRRLLKGISTHLDEVKNGDKKYTGLVSAIVFADVMDHFQKQQGPSGPWAPWSQLYKKRAQEMGRSEGSNMLKMSGRMRNTFTPDKVRGTSDGPLWFNNARTRAGFPYAYWFDEDPKNKKKRPFMWLSETAMDKISDQTLEFIAEEGL